MGWLGKLIIHARDSGHYFFNGLSSASFKENLSQKKTKPDPAAYKVRLDDLVGLRFNTRHLDLRANRRALSAQAGVHASPFRGRGLDFDEVRPYQPGDDIRNIDWNVTARTDRVHSKIFREERERPVFLVVDYRSQMYFGSKKQLKSVAAAHTAALLAWAAADSDNRVAGVVFNDEQQVEIKPKGGFRGVMRLLKMLSDQHLDAPPPPPQQSVPLEQVLASLRKVIHPGSLICFISDFYGINDACKVHLHYLARHNDLLGCFVYDPMEYELPPAGYYPVTDGQHLQMLDTHGESLRQSYHQQFMQKDQLIQNMFTSAGVHLLRLATHNTVVDSVQKVLGVRSTMQRTAKSRH